MREYLNSEMIAEIEERLHSQRDRDLMKRRLIDGLTYEKLSEEFELSVSQVKRIVYKCENIIFRR